MKIIPTIFAQNKKEFDLRFNKLIKLKKDLHIDFMDGKFVKSKGVLISQIPNLKKYKINFEAHLMTRNPEKYIPSLQKKGFKKIIFHYESLNIDKIADLIIKIKKSKMIPILAINPSTQIEEIIIFTKSIKTFLFMGVYPGKEHQKFIPSVYSKIKKFRKLSKSAIIQIDGGVNLSNAKKLKKLGVNILNSGSFISESQNPKITLRNLMRMN